MAKIEILGELWAFMKQRKRYWLAPIVVILMLFGLLLEQTRLRRLP